MFEKFLKRLDPKDIQLKGKHQNLQYTQQLDDDHVSCLSPHPHVKRGLLTSCTTRCSSSCICHYVDSH